MAEQSFTGRGGAFSQFGLSAHGMLNVLLVPSLTSILFGVELGSTSGVMRNIEKFGAVGFDVSSNLSLYKSMIMSASQ